MIYLTDLLTSTMTESDGSDNTDVINTTDKGYDLNILIESPIGHITARLDSHKAAWPKLLKRQLVDAGYHHITVAGMREDYANYDVIVLEPGMEFKDKFNLYGGLTDELVHKLVGIFNSGCELYFAGSKCPDFGAFVMSRKEPLEHFNKPEISEWLTLASATVQSFNRVTKSPQIVVGDSHALSAWRPGYEMSRNDGMTMYGALKLGLAELLEDYHTEAVFYFGNIDIRHHIFRQDNPTDTIQKLINDYVDQIANLDLEKVSVISPLYIENERRVLPKTGWYKGAAFYGTWQQRDWAREYITYLLDYYCAEEGWTLIKHPDSYLNSEGELSFEVMEANRSVHISPRCYPNNLDDQKASLQFDFGGNS
jgi:hypothetical protein